MFSLITGLFLLWRGLPEWRIALSRPAITSITCLFCKKNLPTGSNFKCDFFHLNQNFLNCHPSSKNIWRPTIFWQAIRFLCSLTGLFFAGSSYFPSMTIRVPLIDVFSYFFIFFFNFLNILKFFFHRIRLYHRFSTDLSFNPWAPKLKHCGNFVTQDYSHISCKYILWLFLLFTPLQECDFVRLIIRYKAAVPKLYLVILPDEVCGMIRWNRSEK